MLYCKLCKGSKIYVTGIKIYKEEKVYSKINICLLKQNAVCLTFKRVCDLSQILINCNTINIYVVSYIVVWI